MRTFPTLHGRASLAALAAFLALTLGASGFVLAQDYPAKPVHIIVGYGPGGGTDTMARVLGPSLSKALGQSVVIRNMPGAGGQIAASAVLREGAEGLAILALNHPDLYMAIGRDNAPFKASDFQVIMADVKDPRVFLVAKDSTINSFAEFVARAKAQPGKLAISVAQGSAQELFANWLIRSLGLDIIVAGYKGGNEAATAVLGGEVTATIGDDYARFNFRDRTKALFIGASAPSSRWPEAPSLTSVLAPYGVTPPSPDFLTRYGIYVVPSSFKKAFPAAYAKLQKALIEARATPEFQDYIVKNRLQDLSIGRPGEEFDAAFVADMVGIGKIN